VGVSDRSFLDRVKNLTGEGVTGANGAGLLNRNTVSDDNTHDVLTGRIRFVFNGDDGDQVTDWSVVDGLFDADMM
jgi:hypothetical protein